ncbi:sensor histidine kinase [Actinomycetospora soli]|uniref:sensor histidine kinase n=1 Tax=Actinomycetospora soli TaxID=2893887 RepID=UPI001E62878C|nr:histidine kinase [Actinomycetospora soli]MCD2185664.1 histidine kinase [Actinomycetospora soli]
MTERWDRVPAPVVDGLLALVLTVATQVELSFAETLEGPEWAQRFTFLVATFAVGLRRITPLGAALACAAAMAVQTPLGAASAVGGFLALMIVTHSVALRCEPVAAWVGLVGVLIGVHVYDVLFWEESSVGDLLGNAAIFLGIWGLGRGARRWRRHAEQLRVEAAVAVRDQEEHAREAVRREQARIARELHDVVAHGISVMTLQAGAARQVLSDDQPAVTAALLAVEDNGRRSLDDMHRLLGLLRPSDGSDGGPQGTGVAELVERTRAGGLPVTIVTLGRDDDIPASLALTVHRIVQEALTNALRHGPREDVVVRLHYAPDEVSVEVDDRGHGGGGGTDTRGSGLGLIGMRERVAVFDGELVAGPREGGGWVVRARLPRIGVPV